MDKKKFYEHSPAYFSLPCLAKKGAVKNKKIDLRRAVCGLCEKKALLTLIYPLYSIRQNEMSGTNALIAFIIP